MRAMLTGTALGIVLGGIAVGVSAGAWPSPKPSDRQMAAYQQVGLLMDVMELARTDYVEEIDEIEAIEASIDGMLGSLDPHSSYMNPKEFGELEQTTSGEYGGLGIEVTMTDGLVTIVAPMDDTPASRAGLESGDKFIAINGRPIMGLKLDDAVRDMRGAPGTDLTLTIRREGTDPFDVTLTREIIQPKTVTFRVEDNDIAYFRVSTFNELTTDSLNAAIGNIKRELGPRPSGIILDLRNNGGGLLDQAISITGTFLKGGEVVSTIGRRPGDVTRANANQAEEFNGVPMVVLINEGSASASEIVAGALQDRERALIVGMTSFGKGSVQSVIPLGAERGAVRLTTARYYTPSGRSIQSTGIRPDLEVAAERLSEEDLAKIRRYTEADLPNALDNESGEDRDLPHVPDEQPPEGYNGEDYQLDRAIELLRGGRVLASGDLRAG